MFYVFFSAFFFLFSSTYLSNVVIDHFESVDVSSISMPFYFSSFVLIAFAIFQRRGEVRVSSGRFRTVVFESDPDQLKSAREDIKELLGTKFCHPLMVIFSAFFFDFVIFFHSMFKLIPQL